MSIPTAMLPAAFQALQNEKKDPMPMISYAMGARHGGRVITAQKPLWTTLNGRSLLT